MVQYTCEKCGKIFNKKFNYESHMKRKTSCVKNFDCTHCLKTMSSTSYLKKHIPKCKLNPINNKVIENIN